MFTQKIDPRAVICWLVRWLAALGSAFSVGMLSCALLFLLAELPVAAQSSSKIFGHTYLGSFPNGAETLVSIDPGTGAVSSLGSVPNSGSLFVQAGIAALDSAHHHYFFVDSNSVLHQMDTQTGVESAEIPLSIPVFLAGMRFDSSSGKLFGHTFLNGAETLVSIDSANGSVASVGTVPNSGSLFVQAGIAALDPAQHHYFFVDSNSVLHRMDTQTGVESAENSLSTSLFLAGMELEPGPSAIPVFVDIKPQSCPNPLNLGATGVLPVAILGTSTFDVSTVDPSSVKLQGVSPLRSALEDVATPFTGTLTSATSCTTVGPDGFTDLVLSFSNPEVAAALGTVADGQVLVLTLTGNLKPQFGGSPIKGQDVVVVIKTQ